METGTVENTRSTAVNLANMAARVEEGKLLAEDLVQIGKRKAQRAIRRGREAGEDYLDETTHYIKHHPWQSVGFTLGVGMAVGALLGWTCSRVCRS